VCIVYALLGIPLMLVCLSNIGELMADVFRYVYYNVCCCGCNCFRRRVAKPRPKSGRAATGGGGDQSETEAWKNRYNESNAERDIMADIEDDDEDEENDGETEEMKITVPLTVTLGMLGFYIFVGALLFGVWNSLSWIDAAYFCFITITTIGFGDIVPGASSNSTDAVSSLKRIVTVVYMVFGMAIISMAFNLIQEEVIGKFSWVGEKMGLIKPEDDDDDFEEELDLPVSMNQHSAAATNAIFYVPHAKSQ
jgi:potassium channel subfamily K, invertebrate